MIMSELLLLAYFRFNFTKLFFSLKIKKFDMMELKFIPFPCRGCHMASINSANNYFLSLKLNFTQKLFSCYVYTDIQSLDDFHP